MADEGLDEVDFIDLNPDDDNHSESDHEDATPVPSIEDNDADNESASSDDGDEGALDAIDIDDPFNDDDETEEDEQRFRNKDPDAELMVALAEDGIPMHDRNALAQFYLEYRQRFLEKRADLQDCRELNRGRVRHLNRQVAALEEAVEEFYAVYTLNAEENSRLAEENDALREFLTEDDLADFPEPEPHIDLLASLPRPVWNRLPESTQVYLIQGPRHVLRAGSRRKTEREWPTAAEDFLANSPENVYKTWGDIYKLSCQEENMSWAFGEGRPPKTHPYLKLMPPTKSQEESGKAGALDSCTPPPTPRESESSDKEEEIRPFRFQSLPKKIQLKIFRHVLVFDGVVHTVSRLDPYYEPESLHRNCNGETTLLHRFHIGREPVSLTFGTIHPQRLLAPLLHVELLWMGAQRLTYEVDSKGKYTSRRTHDLAYLTGACRLKTMAVHIPESSKEYMRRKHEPRDMIEYMEKLTRKQPNYRLFRALRTAQGLDYIYCLRGMKEVTFWDYDKWLKEGETRVPVRDWTFVQDINNCVRREKSHHDDHFSQICYLAPVMEGCRPSAALAARLEAFVNRPTGLLTPPPDLYPLLQSSVGNPIVVHGSDDGEDSDNELGSEAEDDSETENGSEAKDSDGESNPDDDDDDDDDGGGDDAVATDNIETIDISDDEADDEDEDHGEAGDGTMEVTHAAEADRVAMPPPAAPMREDSPGHGTESSLFVPSATPESPRPFFVQKLETPSSPGTSSHSEGTPARANREESCLFVGSPLPPPVNRESPIDMTQDIDMPEDQNKRSFDSCSKDDDDDDCRYMGSSPKRIKTENGKGGSGVEGGGSGNDANASSRPFIIDYED
ncbi:unnamed protein product [Fusarium venenatum]|uniref:Uncharacterized protein n=1 Tax=Fusarium venenatum TaxID=56646 RepID=A0A2L2T6D7_9HYPO|nr:uncharacterized protein FVRRES_05097 [Fusarium venenatum]KAH6992219.1 hypothetical protein EDB82DRAFT_535349 [Fusarium venenatum]CEI60661.1 unnamed protein product [Fusarium venenatum]